MTGKNLDYSIIVWVLDKNRKPISSLLNEEIHQFLIKYRL